MMKLNSKTSALLIAVLAAAGLAAADDGALAVSRADAMKNATSKVPPAYPPVARQLGMQGDVEVEARITATGTVESVKPLTGNPVLVNAATAALLKWKFTPFTSDGKPVRAIAPILFTFKL